MKKTQYVKIVAFDIIYVAAMAAISWIIIFCVDFLRIKNKSDPLLCIPVSGKLESISNKNCSKQFLGLGYKILKNNNPQENSYKIMPW